MDDHEAENPTNTRRDRFLRVAEKRTRKVLRDLRLLGNCGNRAAYEYTQNEVQKIFGAIQRELDRTRDRFGRPTTIEFSLGEDGADADDAD